MRRISSPFLLISPTSILQNHVVELNSEGVVSQLIDIEKQIAEPAQTLYYNGIISAEIVSLQNHFTPQEINELSLTYNYINISNLSTDSCVKLNENPLVIDFETNNLNEISQIINNRKNVFSKLNVFQLISACTYYPIQILDLQKQIRVTNCPELVLWSGIDLINKRINDRIHLVNV